MQGGALQGGTLQHGYRKVKGGSLARLALHTVFSFVPPDNLRTDIQTYAKSLKPVGALFNPIEFTEDIGLMVFPDPDAEVTHPDK